MKHRTCFSVLATLLLSLMPAVTLAQLPDSGADKRAVLRMGLYPPDLVMRHQQRLGITDAQRKQMTTAVKTFQSAVADLQWTLQSEQQALRQALAATDIDSAAALEQVDRVLALENDFKRAHFRLLIAIKNTLSETQVGMIDEELRRRRATARDD